MLVINFDKHFWLGEYSNSFINFDELLFNFFLPLPNPHGIFADWKAIQLLN